MPGFYISNDSFLPSQFDEKKENFVTNVLQKENICCARQTGNKFLNDKIFYEDENYIIITEGVILNLRDLEARNNVKSLEALIIKLAKKERPFYSLFRGTFSGAVFFKERNEWIIYTGQHGEHNIFYYKTGDKYYIGSEVGYLLEIIKKNKYPISIDEQAIYYMLTYGYMVDESTYAKEIKCLLPGHVLKIRNGEIEIEQYYNLEKNTIDLSNKSEDEIINELDEKFRLAVQLQFDKDDEYGLEHLADLSGGLDSRMVNWVARDLGYTGILNINYCYSNHLDEIIAKQIAGKLGNEIILFPLDTGKFIFDLDDTVKKSGGLALYIGNTGCMRLLENLNVNRYGLKHGGNLGDVIVGSFLKDEKQEKVIEQDGMYSKLLSNCYNDSTSRKYMDQELYLMNVRGFMANCACSSGILRNWSEMVSPFQNIEFLEYCMSIPVQLRKKHYIYKRWIQKKYPEAAKFVWQKEEVDLQSFIDSPYLWINQRIRKYCHRIIDNIKQLINRMSFGKMEFINKKDMNPMDYWYRNNPNIKKFMDDYFQSNIEVLHLQKKMKDDICRLYCTGNAYDKSLALTAISAVKYYFN